MFSSILKSLKRSLWGEIVHLFNSAGGKWLVFSVIDYRLYHLPLEMQAQRGRDATALDKGFLLSGVVALI